VRDSLKPPVSSDQLTAPEKTVPKAPPEVPLGSNLPARSAGNDRPSREVLSAALVKPSKNPRFLKVYHKNSGLYPAKTELRRYSKIGISLVNRNV
jgi:hypothetical protein